MNSQVLFLIFLSLLTDAKAAIPSGQPSLSERLTYVRSQVIDLEKELLSSMRSKEEAKGNIKKIQNLIALQKKERELGTARVAELEKTIQELESRRATLKERVFTEQTTVKRSLLELRSLSRPLPKNPESIEAERIEQPRAKALRNLIQMGVREIEALRVDLQDADSLEVKISEERGSLDAMIHEMAESEGILELNKKLQLDVIQKTHQERVSQLEKYRALKVAEAQVSDLIQSFNARIELQDTQRTERSTKRAMVAMASSEFSKLKGKLSLPIPGRIIGMFGKSIDPDSRLTVFKKGVDIQTEKSSPVKAVYQGKVAYSGELPNYGKMMIIDHGDHFYSICGKLGTLEKKVGDLVTSGEEIGASDSSGTPVYFEIRARNIPVNPLQWVSN